MFLFPPHAIGRIGLRAAGLLLVAVTMSSGTSGVSIGLADLGLHPPSVAHAAAMHALPASRILFIENRGQRPADILYYAAAGGKSFEFTPNGVRVTTVKPIPAEGDQQADSSRSGLPPAGDVASATAGAAPGRARGLGVDGRFGFGPGSAVPRRRHTVEMKLVGAQSGLRPAGQDRLPTVVSYFKGPRTNWHTGLATFGRIVYHDLWPGIDLEFDGTETGVGYRFVTRPGADASQIRVDWSGLAPGEDVPTGLVQREERGLLETLPLQSSKQEDPHAPVQTPSVFAAYGGYFGYEGELGIGRSASRRTRPGMPTSPAKSWSRAMLSRMRTSPRFSWMGAGWTT